MDLVSLVGFDDVFLVNQAAPASLDHIGAYCQISIQPRQTPSHIKRRGHVETQAEAVRVAAGGAAGHRRKVQGVEAGGKTLGLHEGAGVRKRAGASSRAVLLPALTVRRERGEDVVPGGAAPAHLAHGRTVSRTPRLRRGSGMHRRTVVARRRLGPHRTGAQFQHDGRAAWGLSIVLQGETEDEV